MAPSGDRQSPTAKPSSRIAHFTGIGLVVREERREQRRQLEVDGCGGGVVAAREGVPQLPHLPRAHMRRDADDAVAADGERRQEQVVVAAPEGEAGGTVAQDRAELGEVAARFLDADDVRVAPREFEQRRRQHVRAGPARDVVHDDRQPRRLCDGAEVAQHAVLGRLVIVGHDGEDTVCARGLRARGQRDRRGGIVAAGPGHDRAARAEFFLDGREQRDFLVVGQRGRLTRRTAHDDAVVALRDEPRRDARRFAHVHRTRLVVRSHHRRQDTAQLEPGTPAVHAIASSPVPPAA